MIKREYGEMTTLETRTEAHEKVDKDLRYSQIIECLLDSRIGMTAKEIAVVMMQKGQIPTSERNFVSPRITEMMESGVIEPIGKTKCEYTGRTVTVFKLCNDYEQFKQAFGV